MTTTTVFPWKTFTGLLTNYLSFTAPSYKIGHVRTLVDRTFKFNNTWAGFHNAVKNLTFILHKNLVRETFQHISTRIHEHLRRDKPSHIFQHLQHSEECRRVCPESCFSILDTAPNCFQLLLKEAVHICWENPSLNRQLKHAELTLSF